MGLNRGLWQRGEGESGRGRVSCRVGGLSGPSGLVLVKRLNELDAATRIVVVTGYASIATAVEAVKLGATHYLAKPVDADDVLALKRNQETVHAEVQSYLDDAILQQGPAPPQPSKAQPENALAHPETVDTQPPVVCRL